MFPFVTEQSEFREARAHAAARDPPREIAGPSGARRAAGNRRDAGDAEPGLSRREAFFELTDFISIGGNDLKQFFFAADRENERVRRRYDTLNLRS
jgi:phosphotransferase system enzyme I (PtsP)